MHFDFLEFCLSSASATQTKPKGWDLLPKADSYDTPVNMAMLMLAGRAVRNFWRSLVVRKIITIDKYIF